MPRPSLPVDRLIEEGLRDASGTPSPSCQAGSDCLTSPGSRQEASADDIKAHQLQSSLTLKFGEKLQSVLNNGNE